MMLKAKNDRKWIVMVTILAIITIPQFFNKPLAGKAVTEKINAPEDVMLVLKKSCFSCHSNEQNLSWMEKIAPVSWIVNKDISRAREVMNFSEWNNTPMVHEGRMYAILNMLQGEKMPLPEYALFHPSTKVTSKDIATVKAYTLGLSRKSHTKISLSENMPAKISTPLKYPISPNGIAYMKDFKKWKVISLTTLFDHSVRVVYGNDIAVKAIETENFHPWPDGSIVVKSVWKELIMPNGEIRTGDFINAQFMVKDTKKYKETEGWGFAKFSGNNLIPTGTSPLFAQQSCISCHRQLAETTGYLFNVPMKKNDSTIIKHLLR